jgi:hypothetical protein
MVLKSPRRIYGLLAAALSFVSLQYAVASDATTTEAAAPTTSNYYFYLAGGSALTNPNSAFSQTVNDFIAQGGRINTVGVIEAPGFYRKKTDQLWIGILPSFVDEEFSGNYQQTTSLAMDHFNVDASAWWFFHSPAQAGFIARVDLGYTYIHEYNAVNGVSNDSYFNGSNLKITGGYTLPIFNNGDFWSFNFGLFGVTAGSFSETGADLTVGVML